VTVAVAVVVVVVAVLGARGAGRRLARRGALPAVDEPRGMAGAQVRYRRTSRSATTWEPTCVTVADLRRHALDRHPDAAGIHFADDPALHCRACLTDPTIRTLVVDVRADHERATVLFGRSAREMLDRRCATHGADT